MCICASIVYTRTCARDVVNAAVRMNLIEPLEGGRLMNELCTSIEELVQLQLVPRLTTTGVSFHLSDGGQKEVHGVRGVYPMTYFH